MPTTVRSRVIAVPNILLDDFFPLFVLFISMSRIVCGNIKKKTGKKCVYNPTDLEAAVPEIQQRTAKKVAGRK